MNSPCEHWYASTALDDLLGIPDEAVTKDRLYLTLDGLLKAQIAIEYDLKDRFGSLFQLQYDLLLYDLSSSYFEGLAEENDLAQRGYSRDHRSDCKQIVIALVVTRDGFALWKTLDHLAKRAGLMTLIHKPDPRRDKATPKPRPMTPEVILRELSRIQMGDIHLPTTDGRQLDIKR